MDPNIIQTLLETICGIANVGPDADGFLYLGIADKPADVGRIQALNGAETVKFDHVQIVGIEREVRQLKLEIDKYMRLVVGPG
jgi:hypothetical protein